jgi:F-type H+-transporting ATPase subunit b
MIEDAKSAAKTEAEKVLTSARQSINAEKAAALAELKTQVAAFSLEIAEKIVRTELSSEDKQKALADKMAGDINLN